jgi:nicotinamide-nucleotide amidase
MNATIVCIGDEVLSGKVVNTNASYLSKKISEVGFYVKEHLVISDYDEDAEKIFIDLSKTNDLVIVTGGLGPTVDDLTRPLIAKLVGTTLHFDEALYQTLCHRYKENEYHKIQATVPLGIEKIDNFTGTACGFHFVKNKCHFLSLPGVPSELYDMFEKTCLPQILKYFPMLKKPYEVILHFFDLIEVELDPSLIEFKKKYPDLTLGIYPSYGQIKVVISSNDMQEVHWAKQELQKRFSSNLFESDVGRIDDAVFRILEKKKKTLSIAESITGGNIAAKLVSNPGVSCCFLGSLVTYSNELKKELLGVDAKLLQDFGAVSSQVAEAMCKGVLKKTGSDFALATTGIAGPSGGEHKPVGTVFVAIGSKERRIDVRKFEFSGNRSIIIEKASNYALCALYKLIYTS